MLGKRLTNRSDSDPTSEIGNKEDVNQVSCSAGGWQAIGNGLTDRSDSDHTLETSSEKNINQVPYSQAVGNLVCRKTGEALLTIGVEDFPG